MTRGYFVIIGKGKKLEECGYLCSSAYPAFYGLQILSAISAGTESKFIQQLRKEDGSPPDIMAMSIDWLVRRPGDKETSPYEFPEYSYILQRNSRILSIYRYGKLLYRIRPEEIPLFQFVFENDNDLERALSIDSETNIEAKDGTAELKRLIKEHPTVAFLQKIIDTAPAVSVPKKNDIRSMRDSLWHDRTVHVCELSVYGPEMTEDRELDWSVRTRRYNVALEFRQEFGDKGFYYATLTAKNAFRTDVYTSEVGFKPKLSYPKAYMGSAAFVKKHQDDIVRLSVAGQYHAYALSRLQNKSCTDAEAIAAGKEAIKRVHALCAGHPSAIGDFENSMCSALERDIYRRSMGGYLSTSVQN